MDSTSALLEEQPVAVQTISADASNRCDRCGAQAWLEVSLTTGGSLMFCGHHYEDHKDVLEPLTSSLVDDREFIK